MVLSIEVFHHELFQELSAEHKLHLDLSEEEIDSWET